MPDDRKEEPPVDDPVRRVSDPHERIVELPKCVDGPIELGRLASAGSRSSHGQSMNRGEKKRITRTNATRLAAIGARRLAKGIAGGRSTVIANRSLQPRRTPPRR